MGTKVDISKDHVELFNKNKNIYGTENALKTNSIFGVSQGFKRTLKFVGIGYRVALQDQNVLTMRLGYSHEITYTVPEKINLIIPKPDTLILFSSNKELLGKTVREIQKYKKPDSYKGKGIVLDNES